MLEIRNVGWTLPDGADILKDVSITIGEGKLVVITGPNGGGKTTLAKVVAGLVRPTTGSIWLDGKDITHMDITQRALQGISYGFQQPVRFKGLTVRELMELSAGHDLDMDGLCDLLGKVGLCTLDYIDRDVDGSLSGGEIKRVEIASVLARGTRIMIFDEPEAGIDLWSFNSLVSAFERLKDSHHTMIIISHQQRIIEIADEIIVLADGGIRLSGLREDVLPLLLESEMAGYCPVGKKVIA
ncbi:MAG: ABC transporter ATP-binding protein [Christensenellales bacterium]